MGTPRRIIGLAVALTAVVAAPAAAAPVKLPHLVPLLPSTVSAGQQAPVFVDPLEQPGRLLYRFDAVIANTGGALDVFALGPTTGAASNDVRQALWAGGAPTAHPQDPNADPTSLPGVTVSDRTALSPGATLRYASESGHGDWRVLRAAEYALEVPGQPDRTSGRDLGSCLVDSYGPLAPGATSYYPEGHTGGDADPDHTWCQRHQSPLAGTADPPLVRGGISPGWGALDASQDDGRWIDVTGLVPGSYALRATVNPAGHLDASPPVGGDDVLTEERVIPGVTAAAATASTAFGTAAAVALSGTVVGPGIPARTSATGPCSDESLSPTTPLASCYRTADAAGPLTLAVAGAPAHGTVVIGAASGVGATATYTPSAGYSGPDSFSYTATDARGLTSAPATVHLTVAAPLPTADPAVLGSIALPRRLSDAKRLAVTVRFGRTVCGAYVRLVGSRLTRNPAPYHALAARRVGCARQVHLVARRPRPGLWRVRVVVLLPGRSFVSSIRRVIVSAPKPTGPDKTG